jgi:hypothetical protein
MSEPTWNPGLPPCHICGNPLALEKKSAHLPTQLGSMAGPVDNVVHHRMFCRRCGWEKVIYTAQKVREEP